MSKKTFTIAEIDWKKGPEWTGASEGQLGDWFVEIRPMGEVFILTTSVWGHPNLREENILPSFDRAKQKAQEMISEWLSPYLVKGGSE